VALASHNYNVADDRGLYDYSQHFARINKLCDEQGCDTILYALYTEKNIGLILNPIHDYMTPRMLKKRLNYSLDRRTVISVWNQGRPERKGKGSEAPLPWTVYHDGNKRTNAVQELPRPFSNRPDIRIGVLDLASLNGG